MMQPAVQAPVGSLQQAHRCCPKRSRGMAGLQKRCIRQIEKTGTNCAERPYTIDFGLQTARVAAGNDRTECRHCFANGMLGVLGDSTRDSPVSPSHERQLSVWSICVLGGAGLPQLLFNGGCQWIKDWCSLLRQQWTRSTLSWVR